MNGSEISVPSFQIPSGDLNFLASEENLYDYSNLYGFSEWLHHELEDVSFSEKQPLLILSHSSDKLIFLIAASFLLDIPILSLNPGSTQQELDNTFKHVNPAAVYTDQEKDFGDNRAAMISIPTTALKEKAAWNSELFTLAKPGSTAGLFLTSGSTGAPKIVPIKRRQVFFAASASAENFKPGHNRYWLLCLPLNHIGGISIIYRSLLYQSAIYRMENFDVNQVKVFLSENKLFQVASFVPTMLIKLLEFPLFQVHKQFKALLLGGGPVSLDLIKQSETKGIPIVSSYGMTETCAQIAANPVLKPMGMYVPKKSVGRIFPPNEIEIRNEGGSAVPPIESGRIWLKGPQVFDGYTDEDLNRKVFDEDGWFDTGDYGHINRLNQLFVENRRTDLIISGGENVNPFEVEEALNSLEEIQEAAVVGVPDKEWGQKVVAYIITEQESKPDTDSLRKELQNRLSSFKIPKEFHFIEAIPKSDMGKILRYDLISRYGKKEKMV
ncbi:MAG: o-succinylbenzoate--CoA ligase [Balneolaceae bacterium]